jgi:hypothetical protein
VHGFFADSTKAQLSQFSFLAETPFLQRNVDKF